MTALPTQAPWYRAALALVVERHAQQVDKLGRPMVEHFERVARRLVAMVPDATPAQVQAALLHDAFEPGGVDPAELERRGVLDGAIRIIRRITLPTDGRTYLQYAADLAASGDVEAVQVKLADNLDAIELFTTIGTDEALGRVQRQYLPSKAILSSVLPAAT